MQNVKPFDCLNNMPAGILIHPPPHDSGYTIVCSLPWYAAWNDACEMQSGRQQKMCWRSSLNNSGKSPLAPQTRDNVTHKEIHNMLPSAVHFPFNFSSRGLDGLVWVHSLQPSGHRSVCFFDNCICHTVHDIRKNEDAVTGLCLVQSTP